MNDVLEEKISLNLPCLLYLDKNIWNEIIYKIENQKDTYI